MRKFKFEIPALVQAELDARDAKQKKATVEALESGVFQLEYPWANDKRGMPKVLLRSALFGVVRRGRREYLQGAQIAAWGESYIRYTGGNSCNLIRICGWHVLKHASVQGKRRWSSRRVSY